MVAMSMADGFARLTNKPQAVIVHVDVGTQGLGAAVHNASAGRAPVLVFAGISPITQEGELRGSRTEFIHWIQDVPDQKQIVAQYCRYSAELKTGVNVKQMVNRALQFARSAPQGPVYLCASREVMETEMVPYEIKQDQWEPVELGGLPSGAVKKIAEALAGAEEPLLITGYAGRNQAVPAALVQLADAVKGLRVLDTGGSDMCFPADHPGWLGLRYGVEDAIRTADVIVVLDCDVPWISTQCKPREDARVFHIDVDPLKQVMPLFYISAQHRYRADALTAVEQVLAALSSDAALGAQLAGEARDKKWTALQASYAQRLETIAARSKPLDNGEFGTSHLCARLRDLCPKDTLWAIEAVTNTLFVHDALQPTIPGQWINCGGGGLGWSGGGALGMKLASEHEAQLKGGSAKGKFVVQIVGDGTFLFSVPGSVYWISKRYNIPVLTIVLNNKGKLVSEEISGSEGDEIADRCFFFDRLERPPQVAAACPPRRAGRACDQRGDQHLVHAGARLRGHRQGGGGRRPLCRAGRPGGGSGPGARRGHRGGPGGPDGGGRLQGHVGLLNAELARPPFPRATSHNPPTRSRMYAWHVACRLPRGGVQANGSRWDGQGDGMVRCGDETSEERGMAMGPRASVMAFTVHSAPCLAYPLFLVSDQYRREAVLYPTHRGHKRAPLQPFGRHPAPG